MPQNINESFGFIFWATMRKRTPDALGKKAIAAATVDPMVGQMHTWMHTPRRTVTIKAFYI